MSKGLKVGYRANAFRSGVGDLKPTKDAWVEFFGQPKYQTTQYYDPKDRSTWTIPDAYQGERRALSDQIDYVVAADENWYTSKVMPILDVDETSQRIEFNRITFDPQIARHTPILGTVRLLRSERRSVTAAFDRNGIGFYFEHGFMNTSQGIETYKHQLVQAAMSVIEANKVDVIITLQQADDKNREYEDAHTVYKGKKIEQALSTQVAQWACLQKKERAILDLDTSIVSNMERYKGRADAYIVPRAVLYHLATDAVEMDYSRSGQSAQKFREDGVDGIKKIRNCDVYVTRSYDIDSATQNKDLMKWTVEIGEYAAMYDRSRGKSSDGYQTAERSIKVYDEDTDTFREITLAQALDHSHLFREDGRPAKPPHGADKLYDRYGDAARGHLFTYIDGDDDVRQCKYFGQISLAYTDTGDKIELAKTIAAGVGAGGASDYRAASRMFADCVAYARTLGDIAYDHSAVTEFQANVSGGSSRKRQNVLANNAWIPESDTGTLRIPDDAQSIPPGYCNWQGIKELRRHALRHTEFYKACTKELDQAVKHHDFIVALVEHLQTVLPGCNLINPDLAQGNAAHASPESVFWENAVMQDTVTLFMAYSAEKDNGVPNQNVSSSDSSSSNTNNNNNDDEGRESGGRLGMFKSLKKARAKYIARIGSALFGKQTDEGDLEAEVGSAASMLAAAQEGADFQSDQTIPQLLRAILSYADSELAVVDGQQEAASAAQGAMTALSGVLEQRTTEAQWRSGGETNALLRQEHIFSCSLAAVLGAFAAESAQGDGETESSDLMMYALQRLSGLLRKAKALVGTPERYKQAARGAVSKLVGERETGTSLEVGLATFDSVLEDLGVAQGAVSGGGEEEEGGYSFYRTPLSCSRRLADSIVAFASREGRATPLLSFNKEDMESQRSAVSSLKLLRGLQAGNAGAAPSDKKLLARFSSGYAPASHRLIELQCSDRLLAAIAHCFDHTPINKIVYQRFIQNNVLVPLGFIAFRPHAGYQTYGIIKCLQGREMGSLVQKPGRFEVGDDANIHAHIATYVAESKAVVWAPENVYNASNVMCVGYQGGMGVEPIDPNFYRIGETGTGSIAFVAVPYSYSHKGILSTTGTVGDIRDKYQLDGKDVLQYPTAPYYNALYGWMSYKCDRSELGGQENYPCDRFNVNELCFLGTTLYYSRTTRDFTLKEEGRGHWGNGATYPGCGSVRQGNGRFEPYNWGSITIA